MESAGLHLETNLDIAQALAICPLREGHRPELLGARHALDVAIADMIEGLPGLGVYPLREQRPARVHRCPCGRNPVRLPDRQSTVEIGDTHHRSESRVNHAFQQFDRSFNRTAVTFQGTYATLVSVIDLLK